MATHSSVLAWRIPGMGEPGGLLSLGSHRVGYNWSDLAAGKITRPFRYDLNQIPYDYTVEVRNRFKGLDLIDKVPDELWTRFVTLYTRQGSRPSPWKRNAKPNSRKSLWYRWLLQLQIFTIFSFGGSQRHNHVKGSKKYSSKEYSVALFNAEFQKCS